MTNGNVSKLLAAATVLCALAACNNNKHPINPELKPQEKGVAGGTGAAATGCASSAALTEKDVTDAPTSAHYNSAEARNGIDCSLEIAAEGKAPVCIAMQKEEGSEPDNNVAKNIILVKGAQAELDKYGLRHAQVTLEENYREDGQAPSGQFNLEFAGAPGQTQFEYQNNGERFEGVGPVKPATLNFVIGDGGKGSVSYTATMTCTVGPLAAKKPAPAPEKTTAPVPAPEKTGVPAPQKTGTPAQQQAPSKGGAQQK